MIGPAGSPPVLLGREAAGVLAGIDAVCFADPWSEASFSEALGGERYRFWGIFRDGTVVGYAGLFLTPDGGEITGLAVLPDHRARGLGRALLQTLIDEAERLGLPALRLEVRESNLPARRLYESLGFLVDGRRRRYYRRPAEDAILMSRPVGREEIS